MSYQTTVAFPKVGLCLNVFAQQKTPSNHWAKELAESFLVLDSICDFTSIPSASLGIYRKDFSPDSKGSKHEPAQIFYPPGNRMPSPGFFIRIRKYLIHGILLIHEIRTTGPPILRSMVKKWIRLARHCHRPPPDWIQSRRTGKGVLE